VTPVCRTGNSSLLCSKDLTFCSATNLRIDFTRLQDRVKGENLRYAMDLFMPGDVSVECDLNEDWLSQQLELLSPLQSWAPELRNLKKSRSFEPKDKDCDLTFSQPTFIMKLDATSNIYHHFCDFFNLYLSIHINASLANSHAESWLLGEKQVLVLDNTRYLSPLAPVWAAFTSQPLLNLESMAGKAVCFRQAVFPLLPRMLWGLFYNTPLVPGCSHSQLFTDFSAFLLHRLSATALPSPPPLLRVTFLSREQGGYRRILNEAELVSTLEASGMYRVRLARFHHSVPFRSQLEIVANTDILVGVHGAGLTHTLFLPTWGEVVEVFNCGDADCYRDLARLRGVGYSTWDSTKEHLVTKVEAGLGGRYEKGPAHLKFKNYRFDSDEFFSLISNARERIINKFRNAQQGEIMPVLKEEL